MPDTVLAERDDGGTNWSDLPRLSHESAEVIRGLARRAAEMEQAGRSVDELALFHERLKADLMLGIKVQRNSVLGDAPIDSTASLELPRIALPEQDEPPLPSLDEVLRRRRSGRDYSDRAVDLATVARLLLLGFGVKSRIRAYGRKGVPTFRAPTGGGLQSTRILLIVQNIEGLQRGIYEYLPDGHVLVLLSRGEVRWKMFELCAFQDWVAHAAGVIALVTDLRRVRWKYEERSYRLAHLDAGVIAQNMHLSATALGLASCLVFGYVDEEMDRFLGLRGGADEFTSMLMPFGHAVPRYTLAARANSS